MKATLLILASVASISLVAQNNFKKQLPEQIKYTASIVDETFGITIYEKLNLDLGGDSVRKEGGYVVQNWKEDFYENGQLLHKGFYIDGQLKVYKNYYPDGQLERDFVNVDGYHSKCTLYFPNGKIKSQVTYYEGAPLVWSDYFDNGNIQYYEEYDKKMLFHIAKRSYYKNGQAESLMELIDKKKLTYTQNEFYETGNKRVVGSLIYDMNVFDYYKTGKWIYFGNSGAPTKEELYNNGKITNTINL
jgi:antitoxin component YwqK of YwqJK toxin-antitoxin module